MKKMMICTAALLMMCAGCSKKTTPSVSENPVSEQGTVAISAAGFTENQAETLMTAIVTNHCAAAGIACKVTAVSVSGNDVIANYQYEKNGETVDASAVLSNVTVNTEDPNQVSYVSASFEDGAAKNVKPASDEKEEAKPEDQEEEKTEDKKDEKDDKKDEKKDKLNLKHFDVPNKAPDLNEAGATDAVTVITEPGVRLYRIYVTRENFVAEGTYEGDGTFHVVLMDMNQKVEGVAIEQKGPGDFFGVIPTTEGFHYMLLETDSGGWTFKWSAVPDDMVPAHN